MGILLNIIITKIKSSLVLSFLVATLLNPFIVAQANEEVYQICLDHMPPRQIFQEGKAPRGRNVDIAKAFSEEVGFALTYSANIPFNRCLRYMEEGKTDLMVGLVSSPEREKHMAFIPIADAAKRHLYIRESDDLNIQQLEDTRGLKVGMVRHYAYFNTYAPMFKDTNVFELSTLEEGFSLLAIGKIDAVVAADHVGEELSALFASQAKIVASKLSLTSSKPANLAISKHSPAYLKLTQFEDAAKRLFETGVLKK